MKGRKRTPTKILAMRGSWLAKTRDREPHPPPLAPRAPAWLDKEARRLWRVWWKRLAACGILTEADEVTFAKYCATLSKWIELEAFWQKHGSVYPIRDQKGAVTSFAIFPQIGLYLRLSDALIKMEQQFGLTPASRAMLKTPHEVPKHGNAKEHEGKMRFFTAAGD